MDVAAAVEVHIGTPPGPLTDWAVSKIHTHGFAALPTTRGSKVRSPEFSCFGHQWVVAIYPGGKDDSSREGYVSVFLHNESPESIQAYTKIFMKHPTDRAKTIVGGAAGSMLTFNARSRSAEDSWGKHNFAKRETMLTYLINGTLTFEIHLRTNKQTVPASFVPSNPFCNNMLKFFNNEEKTDVKFELGGEVESAANRRKRAKTTATTFHASHLILDANAPALADMCRPGDEAAVPINGVEPKVFKMLLYFCYGGTIEEEELAANVKAIMRQPTVLGSSTSNSRPRPR